MYQLNCSRRLIAVAIPAVLYVAAIFMPNAAFTTLCFHTPFIVCHKYVFECYQYFFFYSRGDVSDICYLAGWMVNPVFLLAIVFIAKGWRRMAMICASVACLFAFGLYCNGSWVLIFPAYWFWSASLIAAFLSAKLLLKRSAQSQVEDYGPLAVAER
jgi:hypothetical protein